MKDEFEKLGDVAANVVATLTPTPDYAAIIKQVPPNITPYHMASREQWLRGRGTTIGASDLPALFGLHKYKTPFQLYAEKSGQYTLEFPKADIREWSIHVPPAERGNLMEGPAFELLRWLRPEWTVVPNQIPGGFVFVDRSARMSSTPDVFVFGPNDRKSTVQIKSMTDYVFKEDWNVNGEPEVPLSVAIQCIADATLSNCDKAYAAALVMGFNFELYLFEVPMHAGTMAKSRELVADFWDRVEDERPYPPDYSRDGDVIASLYSHDDGTEIDLTNDTRVSEIIPEYTALKAREKDGSDAEKARKELDAELLHRIGNATTARLGDGLVLTAKTIRRKPYSVEASSYRPIKIGPPKVKK